MSLRMITACLALTSACSVSCTNSASQADTNVLTVGLTGTVSTLDDTASTSSVGFTVTSLGVERLMRVAPDGKLEPHLAKSVAHPDATTYLYTLRPGITFWDGSALTADDVAFSMNHARRAKSQLASFFASVRDITADDGDTVRVTLKHPDASWKYTPTLAPVFQKAFAEKHGDSHGKPGVLVMGTGPWKFADLAATRGVELVRNDNYWNGRPAFDQIKIEFLADDTSAAFAFRAGEIDVAFPADARSYESISGTKLVSSGPTCSSMVMSMNTKLEPWSDIHVRRAVAHAVDREGIVKALGDDVTPTSRLIPRPMWDGAVPAAEADKIYESLPTYEYDLDKARSELARSAYPGGFSATINTSSNLTETSIANQALAASLAKIGIRIAVKRVPNSQWLKQLYGPRADIPVFTMPIGCGTVPDPSFYPGILLDSAAATEGGTNVADYTKPEVDRLVRVGLRTDTPAKRLSIYRDLLHQVSEDVPYVPLYSLEGYVALSEQFVWPGFDEMYSVQPWALSIKAKA
ncbi:ABC transporter substrate-binding protein [Nonomuraea sp. KC401]|uniref:ABC transporter substrate-binding protein n=1 Tax=unclassified Nonomuraea TaxID=2593643 RepID=UPI0010FCFC31|nr:MULTISPECIES: ABC transporter substrate-binding protein [unclassified Nonomuraea]NBE92261.1 hypothetical protein [Nonomuraea sp. K271]TLF77219.1 ABC transporter substrate-binding protein [Nonomuraea sp. KC401]